MAEPLLGNVDNALILAGITAPTDDDTARMTLLVGHASAAIRAFTRLTISEATTTVHLAGCWGPDLLLPEWPVTAVSEVKDRDAVITGWSWDRRRSLNRSLPGWPLCDDDCSTPRSTQGATGRGSGGTWGGPRATVTVTYAHGWAVIPEDIAAIAEGMAASCMATPVGVRQEQLGSYSVTYAAETLSASPRITIFESKALTRYRTMFL